MRRFNIRGTRADTWGDFRQGFEEIVTADDPDAAVRAVRKRFAGVEVEAVVEVPDDEGRGRLWRVLRWLGCV
jgi:hypothetical protein